MRIKNKEIRQRRHRKEQKVKEAQRLLRAQYGDKKTGGATAVKAKPTQAKRSATAKTVDSKPKSAPRPKKAEGE
ncbi:MAG: hypothetical protein P4L46_08460 [Fimbriimonas sp.]|nr:hypothetical protein [Fimbriimonas sp.]